MSMYDLVVIFIFVWGFSFLPWWIIYVRDRAPSPSESLFSYEKTEKFIEFPWGKLWVYDSDPKGLQTGTPIVLVHSMGGSIYSWRYQIGSLSQTHRVIAFDLLGFGKSDKPLDVSFGLDAQEERMIELLNKLEIKKCHFVGCSLGGALSLWISSRYPERVEKIVAIAPAAMPNLVPFVAIRHHLINPLASRLISRSIVRVALGNGFAYKKNITPEVIDNYYAPFSEPNGMTCFLRTVDTIKDPRIFEQLKSVVAPVLILWGKKDRVVTRSIINKIIHELPSAKSLFHGTGGHHLMEDEPQWTNEKILDFLDESHRKEGGFPDESHSQT
jgi:pimeloyl-ACP methyl ester carboxylesterase